MKKTLLAFLSVVCLSSLVVFATTTTTSTTASNSSYSARPSFEKMGPPPQGGNFSNMSMPPMGNFSSRHTPSNGSFNGGQRPSKKPDSMPGGRRIPPEFSQSSNSSSASN